MKPEKDINPELLELITQKTEPLDWEAYALLYYKERNEQPPGLRPPPVDVVESE